MNSHRSNLRFPKADFLVVYCKDPVQGLVLGFYRNILTLVMLCFPQVFPSVTAALGVVLTPHDRSKSHSLLSALGGQQHSWYINSCCSVFIRSSNYGKPKAAPFKKKVLCVKNLNILKGGLALCFHFWLYTCFWGGQKKAQPQPNTGHFLFFPAQPFSCCHTLCLSSPLMWDTGTSFLSRLVLMAQLSYEWGQFLLPSSQG